MYLSKIALKQFRSYEDKSFSFDKSLTLITGNNGAGKTNLLEAVYVLLQGSSFRVNDRDMIRSDTAWWRIDGLIDGLPRQLRYQLDHRPAKQIVINETPKRLMYGDRLPVVLFEPGDLQLVHGSPARRRDTIDTILSSLSQPYKTALGRYERALGQRNNALKQYGQSSDDLLFSWDVLLSEYGVTILQARYELVRKLNELLSAYYSQISGKTETVTVRYISSLPETVTSSQFIAGLHTKRQLDSLRGTTSIGPHRDDIEFFINTEPAKTSASRGEVRTLLLSLKIANAKLLHDTYDINPLILLDDVFSELDATRQSNLLSLTESNQVIITDTQNHTSQKVHEINI